MNKAGCKAWMGALFLGALGTQAANISWTVDLLSGAGDVSTKGTLLEALNFSGGATASDYDTTVNGVPFLGLSNGGTGNGFNDPTATYFSADSQKVTPSTVNNYAVPPGVAAFDELLSRWLFGGVSGGVGNNITLKHLISGREYEIQLFIAGSDTSYIVIDAGTANAFGDSASTTMGNTGIVLTGTFMADSTNQVMTLTKYNSNGSIPNNPMHLNGYQLRSTGAWNASISTAPYLSEQNGQLVYGDMNLQGDRLIDFSQVGYKGGEPIPDIDDIPVVKVVWPTGADDSATIQQAVNQVGSLPVQANGYRGAILLAEGTYDIRNQINIQDSGVVLRGAGVGKTILTSAPDAAALYDNLFINVGGSSGVAPTTELMGATTGNNPCGLRKVVYNHTSGSLSVPVVGDWISVKMQMDVNGQAAIGIVSPSGEKNRGEVRMKVVGVTSLGGSAYELETDIPLVFGLRDELGGGDVYKLTPNANVPKNIGVRDMTIQPQYELDSGGLLVRDCKGVAIYADYCEDVWFENIVMLNFYGNGIQPLDQCFQATLAHCHVQCMPLASDELSGGGYFTGGAYGFRGERVLMSALTCNSQRHGPLGNQTAAYVAIVDLLRPDNGCEPGHADMVPGIMYDRPGRALPEGKINAIFFGEPGHGWGTQNSVFWNYVLEEMNCESPRSNGAERVHFDDTYVTFPPDASEDPFVFRNLSFGGFQSDESDNRYDARDYIAYESFVGPDSLYVRQLIDRLGETEVRNRLPAWQVDGYGPAPAVTINGGSMTFFVYDISKTAYGLSSSDYTIYWTDNVYEPYANWSTYTGPVTIDSSKKYYARVVCTAGYALGLESPILQYDPANEYYSVYFKEFYDELLDVQANIDAALQPEYVFEPSADAHVRNGSYANSNYGSSSVLECKLGSVNYTREAYLKFDLSSLQGRVADHAVLGLNVSSENGLADVHTAYLVSDDTWQEVNITWNNKPTQGAVIDSSPLVSAGSWIEFDVTGYLNAELVGDGVFSLELVSDGNRMVSYHSREAASGNRPELQLSGLWELLQYDDFESGLGTWSVTGVDSFLDTATNGVQGVNSLNLEDDTDNSVATTPNLAASGFNQLQVDFAYQCISMEVGEGFWLQVSTDGGSNYDTVAQWYRNDDFDNRVFYNESVLISGPFNNQTRIRFRCDGSNGGDDVYIDTIGIIGRY